MMHFMAVAPSAMKSMQPFSIGLTTFFMTLRMSDHALSPISPKLYIYHYYSVYAKERKIFFCALF
jgi:hypothetical protein